jgi:FMN phosphatase YigB (HAD superfamily)
MLDNFNQVVTIIDNSKHSVIFFDLTNTLVSKINGQYQLYSDALDTLEVLHDRGYRLGILSNLPNDTTIEEVYAFLKKYGITPYIGYDLIAISSELPGNILKPDKRIFDLALRKSGLVKAGSNSIFVTEEFEHILAARRYDWRAILKRNSGECKPEDGECVSSLSGLLDLL